MYNIYMADMVCLDCKDVKKNTKLYTVPCSQIQDKTQASHPVHQHQPLLNHLVHFRNNPQVPVKLAHNSLPR